MGEKCCFPLRHLFKRAVHGTKPRISQLFESLSAGSPMLLVHDIG